MDKADINATNAIAIIAFGVGLGVSNFQDYLTINNPDSLFHYLVEMSNSNTIIRFAIRIFLSVASFSILYRFALSFYQNSSVWNYFHRKVSLNGTWIYLFRDNNLNVNIFGVFDIVHSIKGISIVNGNCWYAGTQTICESSQRGTWYSNDVAIGDDTYWVAYQMDVPNPWKNSIEVNYDGVMKVHLTFDKHLKTRSLNGTICDHNALVKHHGRIRAKLMSTEDAELLWNDVEQIKQLAQKYLYTDITSNSAIENCPQQS